MQCPTKQSAKQRQQQRRCGMLYASFHYFSFYSISVQAKKEGGDERAIKGTIKEAKKNTPNRINSTTDEQKQCCLAANMAVM